MYPIRQQPTLVQQSEPQSSDRLPNHPLATALGPLPMRYGKQMLDFEGVPKVSKDTVPAMRRRINNSDTRHRRRFTPQKQATTYRICRARYGGLEPNKGAEIIHHHKNVSKTSFIGEPIRCQRTTIAHGEKIEMDNVVGACTMYGAAIWPGNTFRDRESTS